MKFTFTDIENICGAKVINKHFDGHINSVFTDSREIAPISSSLFIALSGLNRSGSSFIPALQEKGYINFLVNTNDIPIDFEGLNILAVDDTLIALQQLAKHFKQAWTGTTIGITGSNGKTSVKEWLSQLINLSFSVSKNPGSYNSQLGVPLSILKQEQDAEYHILEAGISTQNEMIHLEQMIQPNIGIFTHFGTAHSYGFDNENQKLEEKFKLFNNAQTLFINEDKNIVFKRAQQWMQEKSGRQILSFSLINPNASLFVSEEKNALIFKYKNNAIKIRSKEWNIASIHNVSMSILVALHIGVELDLIQQEVQHFNALPMRLQLQDAINQNTIINDTYSNDLDSLEVALKFLEKQAHTKNKALILGDIVGRAGSIERYQAVIELLNKYRINTFVGIGKELSANQLLFRNNNGYFFNDIDDFFKSDFVKNTHNSALLIKGARKENFEQIVSQFSLKEHQTLLEISLGKLAENFNFFRTKLSADTKILVMVKAFSYGSGIAEVARLVQTMGANYLAVAYADEGAELRKFGIDLPIMVLNVNPQQAELLKKYDLEPVIYSKTQWISLANNLKEHSISYHLEFDTGMKRLGFRADDLEWIYQKINDHSSWELKSVFSHFSSADERINDDFTLGQIQEFTQIFKGIEEQTNRKPMQHICNTAGILNFPQAHFDMVRLGIGLYGYDPTLQFNKTLQPAVNLKTYITQIQSIKKGESVGYSRSYIAKKDTRIAIIPIGYADGLFRSLGNGNAHVYIKSKPYKIIGNICMDMSMVEIADADLNIDDEVIIFENNVQLEALAKAAKTIPYEILTSFGPRLKRIYLED